MEIRFTLAVILAVAAALAVDALTIRRGLDPPGFRQPWRRMTATVLLSLVFLVGVFVPAVTFDQVPEVDVESLGLGTVFQLHAVLLLTLGLWVGLGYGSVVSSRTVAAADLSDRSDLSDLPDLSDPPEPAMPSATASTSRVTPDLLRLFGLRCRDPLREIGLGLGAGAIAWFLVLTAMMVLGLVILALGGEKILATEPPPMIVWMAGLPVAARLAISLSAGVVEELFFRGFLQLRVGIALSSALFVCGHLGYGQPLMLVALTLLSLFYGSLVAWRRNIWAAMAAHTLFDAVQLLVIIPASLRLHQSGGDLVAALAIW